MPINAPLRDRSVSKRHLTFPAKFKGGNATIISNISTTPNPAVISREYIAAVVISLTNITLSGPQTIDGVSVTAGMTVLVNGQTDKSENGPYICENTSWTRVSDINMISGFLVVVRQGTTNANTVWMESLEFDFYTPDVTPLEWVNVAPIPPDIDVDDTDSVYLTKTGDVITADVRRQNTSTVNLTIDGSGLRADAKFQESNYTTVVTSDFDGTMINLKHQDSDTVRIVQTFDGIECEVIEDSIDTVHLKDDAVTTDKIEDNAVTTDKIANDAVTNEKMADDSVGANELLVVNDDGFIDFYDGTGSPVEQGIRVVQEKIGNHYEMNSFTGNLASLITNWTFRFPADNTKAYPPGIYHVDIRALVQAFVVARRVRNVQAFSMEVAVGGGARTVVDRSDQHADPASGVHNFFVNTLRGGLLLDITDSTTVNRYVEVFVDLNITDTTVPGTADRSSVQGYFHIHKLNDASSTIVLDTI